MERTLGYAAYIDCGFAQGAGVPLSVEDPSYGREIANFAGVSIGQIERAIGAARRAFDDGRWSGLPALERAAILRRFVKALSNRAEQITEIIIKEAGCPKSASVMNAQVRGADRASERHH